MIGQFLWNHLKMLDFKLAKQQPNPDVTETTELQTEPLTAGGLV